MSCSTNLIYPTSHGCLSLGMNLLPFIRRLLADDDKGIAEQLDEKVCIEEDCKGLTVRS